MFPITLAVWTSLSTFLPPLPCAPAACTAALSAPQSPPRTQSTALRRRVHVPWTGPASQMDVPYAPFGPRNVFDFHAPPHSVAGQTAPSTSSKRALHDAGPSKWAFRPGKT